MSKEEALNLFVQNRSRLIVTVDAHGAEGDVEEGPNQKETAHRQGTRDARHEEQLEPGAAEPDESTGGRRRELPGEIVGTRRTIQCTSRAAPIQPHVIQTAVRAV
jgi:hypothetical protein